MAGSQSNQNKYVKWIGHMIEKNGFSIHFDKDKFFFLDENGYRVDPKGYLVDEEGNKMKPLDSNENKDIKEFGKVFAIIKEYIKNHSRDFYLQDHVYEEGSESRWWSQQVNKDSERYTGIDKQGKYRVKTPKIVHLNGEGNVDGYIHPNLLTESQYDELKNLLSDKAVCRIVGCRNNYCLRDPKTGEYASIYSGDKKSNPSLSTKVEKGKCGFHRGLKNIETGEKPSVDEVNSFIEELNQEVIRYNESMKNNLVIKKYDELRKDFFGCSSAEDTYNPNQKYKDADSVLFDRIRKADQATLNSTGKNGEKIGGGIIGGFHAEKITISSIDNEGRKADQINNDNIEELNNYLIAEKEKLIKLMEELKQKAEGGSSEQSNSNQQEETGSNNEQKREEEKEVENKKIEIEIDLTKKPAEIVPQNSDDVKKLEDLEKKNKEVKENKNVSLEEAREEAVKKIWHWELEYGIAEQIEIKTQKDGKAEKIHYIAFIENLGSVEEINDFLEFMLKKFIKRSEEQRQEIIDAPLGEARKTVTQRLTGLINKGKKKLKKAFSNTWVYKAYKKVKKNQVSPGKFETENWEDYVKTENNTTALANFERDMRQELAKGIISMGANENNEEKNKDKSIVPWVVGIVGVVILISLIGAFILRQKRVKNKLRK